jgi:hypothetical protein
MLGFASAGLALGLVFAQRFFLGRDVDGGRAFVAVLRDITLPLFGNVALRKNRLHRAYRHTRCAVDTFVRVNVQPIIDFVETVDGAHLHTIGVLAAYTRFSHNVGHN